MTAARYAAAVLLAAATVAAYILNCPALNT
jgi:hypothetical protein